VSEKTLDLLSTMVNTNSLTTESIKVIAEVLKEHQRCLEQLERSLRGHRHRGVSW
jgi:hypothetical protein